MTTKRKSKMWNKVLTVLGNTFHTFHGSTGSREKDLENSIKLIDTTILALLIAGVGQLASVFGGDVIAYLKAIGIEGAVAALAKGSSISKSKKVEKVLYWSLGIVMLVSAYINYQYSVSQHVTGLKGGIYSGIIPFLILVLTYARLSLEEEWNNLTQNSNSILERELKNLISKRGPKKEVEKIRIAELQKLLRLA